MLTAELLTEKLLFPSLPALPEVIFRGFEGESDFPKMLAVIEGSKVVDRIERSDKLEDIIRNYAHLHNSDPCTDMIFAEVKGQVIGYGRCWWEVQGDGLWLGFHLGFLLPEWRRKCIGSTMLHFLQSRLSQIAACQIAAGQLLPETPRCYSAFTADTEHATEVLLAADGYQAVRHNFDMVRPDLENIPDPRLPDNLEVRPALPEHYRTIFDASNEAFRDHWGYIPDPEENFQNMLEDPNFDPSLWRVAWEGDQVAGMVLSFINKAENTEYNRKRGYTENICVRRPWRGKGLARALIYLSLKALKERGMDHAALGVDAENISGALKLYESCGYQTVKRSSIYRKVML
jgi:ribosomal protein S18 acetylase RimI-like enzyme